jgi:tetratricopeptide (TPR) repeat protein
VLGTLDAGSAGGAPPTRSTVGPVTSDGDPADGAQDRGHLLTALHTAARHASLQATVGWSYRTLGSRASRLLRRLSVFAGPVDLAAVEWCTDNDPLGSLAVLVDKSLLHVVDHREGPRYRLADPVRAYAGRRLAEAGEEPAARDRHLEWALAALHGTRFDPDARPRTLSVRALDGIAAELLAAMRWCARGGAGVADGSARRGLRLADGLDPWWREHGGSVEARHWLQRLYDRIARTGERVDDADLARAYLMHAEHAADAGERVRLLADAEAAARRAEDPVLLIRALAGRGGLLRDSGRLVEAERVCRDAVEHADRHGPPGAALPAMIGLAELLWRRGALDEAADLLGGARPVEAAWPQDRGRRTVDMLLGLVALRRGDLVAAHDHLVVALRSRIRHGFHRAAADTVTAMAVRCAVGGDPVTAAVLFGAAEAAPRAGWAPAVAAAGRGAGPFGAFWTQQQSAVRAVLGDAAFDAGYADGARLSLDQAAAIALAVEHPDLAADSTRFGTGARTLS